MTRDGLVARIADKGNCTKKLAEDVLNTVLDAFNYGLTTDGKVQITGWGRLKVTDRAARKGVNPKTGESIDVPASKVISFKAGEQLKQAVLSVKKASPAKKIVKKVAKKK